ncbi:MAG: CYTH domain-containing protein [Mucilaginibacter sp.]
MGVEIERKFLVDHALWHDVDKGMGTHYRQGYLLSDGRHTIRVRVSDTEGYLNMKSEVSSMVRKEYDYPIPLTDALEILDLFTKNGTEKMRYCIPFAGKIWEVDVFLGDNAGLIVAELELEDENEKFEIPAWVNT